MEPLNSAKSVKAHKRLDPLERVMKANRDTCNHPSSEEDHRVYVSSAEQNLTSLRYEGNMIYLATDTIELNKTLTGCRFHCRQQVPG